MRLTVEFELTDESRDAEGKSVFRSAVVVEGNKLSTGTGGTKKESQQIAAKKALYKVHNDPKTSLLLEKLSGEKQIIQVE
jgi:ribonuclease-3